jgi:hypothetical protein
MTTLYLSHTKNEKCGFKKCQNSVLKKKTSSNEEFINEMH